MQWAPIVLFVYNRLDHSRQSLQALQACNGAQESDLIIFSDGSRDESDAHDVQQVREFIHTVKGFASVQIHEREKNVGLAQNIIEGVSKVISMYKTVIVLEDDLICAPNFLLYMNKALASYRDNLQIFSISGFNPPLCKPENYAHEVYLNPRNSSWGWATWEDRWNKVDWEVSDSAQFFKDRKAMKQFEQGGDDLSFMLWKQLNGRLSSWAIRFCYAHYKHHAYSLCPIQSFVQNIGHDGSGRHSEKTNKYTVTLDTSHEVPQFPAHLEMNDKLMKQFRGYYKLSLKKKLKKKIRMDLYG